VRLLGGFQLRYGCQEIDLPMSIQRLVAFVALQARPSLRSHVAASLWLDASEERASANLRSALWKLRQCGKCVVEAGRSQLRLASHVGVDVAELLDVSRRLLRVTADECDDVDIDQLGSGDLLPDWYDDWVVMERERLRQLRLHALETLGQRRAARGRFSEAISACLEAVAIEPLRETAQLALMEAYLAEGNRYDAVRQYRLYTRLLLDELGVQPSSRVQELIDEVMVQ
jgi:DNA-binding SARP family transcriptional activator